jgi:hypothetical protein
MRIQSQFWIMADEAADETLTLLANSRAYAAGLYMAAKDDKRVFASGRSANQ